MSNLQKLLADSESIVIDVRSKNEYEAFHMKNTQNIPLNKIEEYISNGKFDGYKMIYSMCYSGERAKKACEKLRRAGYENSVCLGGLIDISDATLY